MKVNNYDFSSNNLYSEGMINSKGGFDGEFSDEAYKALGIEGILEGEEWCDLMVDEKGNEYAVAGTGSNTCDGEFYFLLVKDAEEELSKKREVVSWLREVSEAGNSVYVVVNGGGISLVSPDVIENLIADINGEDYGDIETLAKGQEYEDFRATMSAEEYDGTDCFMLVHYLAAYNRETFDIQIQHYEL